MLKDFFNRFFIWDTKKKEIFSEIAADVFNEKGLFTDNKNIYSYDNEKGRINDWLKIHKINSTTFSGVMMGDAPDFQNNNYVSILNNVGKRHGIYFLINEANINIASIYLAIRHCIEATWLNDRDQFLFPNNGWQNDSEFHNDCLTFALFHSQNKITSSEGTNHWIPFTEHEVNAQAKFESNFMTNFIKGKIKQEVTNDTLFEKTKTEDQKPLVFSEEATAVFDAGRELWKYYHAQKT